MTGNLHRWMYSKQSLVIAATPGLLITGTATTATEEEPSETSFQGVWLRAASWVAAVPYGAAKVASSLLGGIVGGLTWV